MAKQKKQDQGKQAPTIAPGMNTHDPLEEKASGQAVEEGNSTPVTRLYLDRTPGE
jgi:hypothetical protein